MREDVEMSSVPVYGVGPNTFMEASEAIRFVEAVGHGTVVKYAPNCRAIWVYEKGIWHIIDLVYGRRIREGRPE